MKFRIKYLPAAATNRDEIKAHLSQFYKGTAKRFFALLKEKTYRLKEHPYLCPTSEYNPNYRQMVVEDYLVFYVVKDDEKIIEIHRILHGSMDISKHL